MADFALPNPLILTGTGFDAGEFFEGCHADDGTTPLGGANAHGFGIGESLLTWAFNRPAYGIMEDVEYLKDTLNTYIQKRAFVTCSAAAGVGADYEGVTALQDALAAEGNDSTIYLLNGTYTVANAAVPANPLDISQSQIVIVGESREGVVLSLAAGLSLSITGDDVSLRELRILAAGNGQTVSCQGQGHLIDRCYIDNAALDVDGARDSTFSNLSVGGSGRALYVHGNGYNLHFADIFCNEGLFSAADPVIEVTGVESCTFDRVSGLTGNASTQVLCQVGTTTTYIAFNECYFMSGAGICLNLISGAGPDLSFSNTLFRSRTQRAAYSTGAISGIKFENCTFTCSSAYTGAVPFVSLTAATSVSCGGLMLNCNFNLVGVATTAQQDVLLSGFRGENLHLDYGTGRYDGTTPALQFYQSHFRNVSIDFGDLAAVNMLNNQEAIQIGYGSGAGVETLRVFSAFGDWGSTSVVGLYGNGHEGRAVLDGVIIETSATTRNNRGTIPGTNVGIPLIKVNSFSTLSGFSWHDQSMHAGGLGTIIGTGQLTSVEEITIRDCYIDLNANSDLVDAVIGFSPMVIATGALTAHDIRIENCHIIAVDHSGAGLQDHRPLRAVILLDEGLGGGSPGSIYAVWITHCKVFFGTVSGAGGEVTNRAPIFVTDAVPFFWVVDTLIMAYAVITTEGERKFIYHAGGTGGSVSVGTGGASIFHQNMFITTSAVDPSVGNSAQHNDAAFLNVVDNNLGLA